MKRLFLLGTIVLSQHSFGVLNADLCRWWKYDFQSSSYLCQYIDYNKSLPEAREVEQAFTQQELRIAELEARVKALEEAR